MVARCGTTTAAPRGPSRPARKATASGERSASGRSTNALVGFCTNAVGDGVVVGVGVDGGSVGNGVDVGDCERRSGVGPPMRLEERVAVAPAAGVGALPAGGAEAAVCVNIDVGEETGADGCAPIEHAALHNSVHVTSRPSSARCTAQCLMVRTAPPLAASCR